MSDRRPHGQQRDTPIAELVPIFANYGHHHIPVVDAHEQLVGMITQADLISGLYRQTQLQQRTRRLSSGRSSPERAASAFISSCDIFLRFASSRRHDERTRPRRDAQPDQEGFRAAVGVSLSDAALRAFLRAGRAGRRHHAAAVSAAAAYSRAIRAATGRPSANWPSGCSRSITASSRW